MTIQTVTSEPFVYFLLEDRVPDWVGIPAVKDAIENFIVQSGVCGFYSVFSTSDGVIAVFQPEL